MALTPIAQEVSASMPHVAATSAITLTAAYLDPVMKVLGLVYIVLQIAFVCIKFWMLKNSKKDIE